MLHYNNNHFLINYTVKILLSENSQEVLCGMMSNYTGVLSIELMFSLKRKEEQITIVNSTCPGSIIFNFDGRNGHFLVNTSWISHQMCILDASTSFTIGDSDSNSDTTVIIIAVVLGVLLVFVFALIVVCFINKKVSVYYYKE